MDIELRNKVERIKALKSNEEKNRLEIGEHLYDIRKNGLYKPKFKSFRKFTTYEIEEKAILSRRSCFNYMWAYEALVRDKRFSEWFHSAFQDMAAEFGLPIIYTQDIFWSKQLYKILSQHRKQPSERRRKLIDYFTIRLVNRNKRIKSKFEEQVKELEESKSKIIYDQENLTSAERAGILVAPEEEDDRNKTFYKTHIGDITITANFRSEIRISPLKALVRKEKRYGQFSIEDINSLWIEDILPLLRRLEQLLIVEKKSKGYTVDEPEID